MRGDDRREGEAGEGGRLKKARSNFRVCDVLINYESFGRTFANSSTGDRLRWLRNEFVIVVEPDGKREFFFYVYVDHAHLDQAERLSAWSINSSKE